MISVVSNDNVVSFEGELSQFSITRDFEKKYVNLISNSDMQFDLSQVTKIDTAGLAWILIQVEKSLIFGVNLQLINVPEKLLNLARLSAVEDILPITA